MQCSRMRDEDLTVAKMEVLYGEADAPARERVEAHLRECDACREEMAALRHLRRDLAAWTIAEPARHARTLLPRRAPSWLLAAATLVLAFGTGLALRAQASLRQDLHAQEARALQRERAYREEIASLRTTLASRAPVAAADPETFLQGLDERIEARVRASERRQDERLRTSFADWSSRMESQRRVDLARVAAGLSYLDGRHGQQLARTNELMEYVLGTASAKR
jgi:Putative zinc-finger